MVKDPKLSVSALKVLNTLLSGSSTEMTGAQIGRQAKLASGTLYPILMRLEDAGWLVSRWEMETPQVLGRPRKRFYRFTGVGLNKARAAFREFEPNFGKFSLA